MPNASIEIGNANACIMKSIITTVFHLETRILQKHVQQECFLCKATTMPQKPRHIQSCKVSTLTPTGVRPFFCQKPLKIAILAAFIQENKRKHFF